LREGDEIMDTGQYQLAGIPLVDDKDLLEIYKSFKEIEDVYNGSMIAMGYLNQPAPSVSGNTNIALFRINNSTK
jgi:hypothetical protein